MSKFRGIWLWAGAHAVDDLYQGLVPATVPYFVLDRHYAYLEISGLTLAATLGGSLPQPLFGVLADRYHLRWLAPAGVGLAGTALGLAGLAGSYPVVWTLILLSGVGVAMFHPAAGKAAREVSGGGSAAMGVFAVGGSVGFFLAPVLATPALVAFGVPATALFIPPAVLIAIVLLRHGYRHAGAAGTRPAVAGTDRWVPFSVLTAIEVTRSFAFFGMTTFIELYWLRYLHATRGLAGTALACFLVGGVAGTLLGGRIAERVGPVRTVQFGAFVAGPMFLGLRLAPGPVPALGFAVLAGLALSIPFAVLVKLGQDYLPHRPGTAAGVTLGLGVTIGGLAAPLLAVIAGWYGPQGVLATLCAVPVAAFALGTLLPSPITAPPVAVRR